MKISTTDIKCSIKNEKIFLAGHNGLVGSAVLRKLKEKNYTNENEYK